MIIYFNFQEIKIRTHNKFQKQGTLYKFYIKICEESFVYISFASFIWKDLQ